MKTYEESLLDLEEKYRPYLAKFILVYDSACMGCLKIMPVMSNSGGKQYCYDCSMEISKD